MTAPLTDEQIEAVVISNQMIVREGQYHSSGVAYGMSMDIERLAAEVKRLRDAFDARVHDAEDARHERDAARADLAKAVELLREWNRVESHAEADLFEDRVLAFLAEMDAKR